MSEEIESKRDGATLHRNSGRGVTEKGDAHLYPFCIDYKEYTESFGVSRTVWAKVTKDSLRMRMQPALKLVLGDKNDPRSQPLRLWVIDDEMMHEMREAWLEKYGEPR